MLEYEDIFEKLDKMGSLKTVEMVSFVTKKVSERHCRKCGRWNKTECAFLGKIKNPDSCCCGWYKDKKVEVKSIRRKQN